MTQGRKPINNQEILSEIMGSQESLQEFKDGIKCVEDAVIILGGAQDTLKETISAVAEKTKLSKGFIKKVALAHMAGGAGEILAEAEALVEMLDIAFGEQDEEAF